MEAIAHALEACVTPKRTPFSTPLAADALRVLFSSVFPAYKGDAAARENALYAQHLAGMAYSNSALGLNYALAQTVSACFTAPRVPRGCASAIFLPQVIRFNAQTVCARYEEMARMLSIVPRAQKSLTETMALQLGEIAAQMRIPISLSRFGVSAEAFEERLPAMAEQAAQAPGARENPRPASREQLIKILRCAYTGKPVDF